jgi:hypothetical protein
VANSLKYNAYHVLGLDTTASSKQILQRSNEIAQRLKIDDVPVYELDIPAFGSIRTESAVKDAVRRVQSPKLRVQEYFFWFRCDSDLDKAALALLGKQDYSAAAQVWEQAARGDGDASFKCVRHLALLRSLALLVPENRERIDASLQSWKTLVESEEFWRSFARSYRFDGEYAASDDVLSDFRKNVRGYVSDVYAELQEACKGTDYIYRFQKLFAEKGGRVERDILDPAFQAIQNAVGELNAIDLGEGAKFDSRSAKRVKVAISGIQTELNKVVDAGLFEDSETKVIRDLVANSIRRIVLDLHNYQDELTKASRLLEIAARFAGTESLKSMLAAEVTQIQNNIVERDNSALALDIPGTVGGGKIVFSNSYLTYDNRKVFYKDVVSIAYHAATRSVNFVPISQSYSYMVATSDETISISFGTTLYIDNTRKKDVWLRLAGVSGRLIVPQIVEKLVRRIFQDGGTVHIGGVEFDREGYYRSKMFGGREAVSWRETIYIPAFAAGNVTLWKEKDGKATAFTTVPMSTANAVVLPEFVKSCVDVVRSHARQ